MAKTKEHLSDFVFVSMAKLTLARRDSYLPHLKISIKPDTFAALRTAPLEMVATTVTHILRYILIARKWTDQP